MTHWIWTGTRFIFMLASHIWIRTDLINNNFFKVNIQLNGRNVLYILPICPKHYSHILVATYSNCPIFYISINNWYWTLVSYSHHSFISVNIYAFTKSSIQLLKWNSLQNRKICLFPGHKYHILICILNNRSIIIYNNYNFWTIIHLFSFFFFQTIFFNSLYPSLSFFFLFTLFLLFFHTLSVIDFPYIFKW